jgi:hypothetical protein
MLPIISKKNESEIFKVGDLDIGVIYLEKRKSISIGERMEIDEYEMAKNKAQIIATKLIKTIAKDRNISTDEARELLWPTKSVDGVEEVSVDRSDVIMDYVEDFADLNAISASHEANIAVSIATIVIRHRVAYPITATANAKLNATTLAIEPAYVYLKNKQAIKFGSGNVVVVNGNHDLESDSIKISALSEPIKEGDVGYLMHSNNKRFLCGSDEWNIQNTKLMDERLVAEIYKFYQNERNGWIDPEPVSMDDHEDNEAEGELLQLTGLPSSGESKAIA